MRDDYEIWNIFHDGDITEIAGTLPGDLLIRVEIPYLRKMISPAGSAFHVTLHACTRFDYEPFGQPRTSDSRTIAEGRPEILEAVEDGDLLRILCTDGTITTAYHSATCALEDGQHAAFEDLAYACERYWSEWKDGRRNHTQEPIGARRASGSA